jgi:hypothetical protein
MKNTLLNLTIGLLLTSNIVFAGETDNAQVAKSNETYETIHNGVINTWKGGKTYLEGRYEANKNNAHPVVDTGADTIKDGLDKGAIFLKSFKEAWKKNTQEQQ